VSEQLRDAIGSMAESVWCGYRPSTAIGSDPTLDDPWPHLADAVLAMPELQAIRKALHDYGREALYLWPGCGTVGNALLYECDLPPSVVAWVIEEQP